MEQSKLEREYVVIKNINTNAQVDKAAIKWLEENKQYAWEGDYYFDNPGELVLIFVSLEGHSELKEVEVGLLENNNHA